MMANRKKRADRGYGEKKRQGWAARHQHHAVQVYACPYCRPDAPKTPEAIAVTAARHEDGEATNVE